MPLEPSDSQHDGTEQVVCPYCNHEHTDSWEFQDGETDCAACGKEFHLSSTTETTYTAQRIVGKPNIMPDPDGL